MTRYTVVWVKSVEDELVEIWLAASDRDDIAAATYAVDKELGSDARLKGKEVAEGLRSLNIPPLRIIFTVSEDDRLVEVVRVARL
ncbi:MAG: type II toxin-antitoxin system RelE/ParE family toxin [Planctomycetota bacterium]